MTGKIFDYLQARRPVLLLGFADGVAARLLRDRGAGVVANDPAAIAARLREWLAVKDRTGRVPAVPATALDGLFRGDQLGRYLDILRGVTGGRASGTPRALSGPGRSAPAHLDGAPAPYVSVRTAGRPVTAGPGRPAATSATVR
ncbi:hypothetical protein V2I01_27770 [Micromonospora sp. BRA006-A]|nr:hypothetical protein [Micromonospora sp. BRA006-A]